MMMMCLEVAEELELLERREEAAVAEREQVAEEESALPATRGGRRVAVMNILLYYTIRTSFCSVEEGSTGTSTSGLPSSSFFFSADFFSIVSSDLLEVVAAAANF